MSCNIRVLSSNLYGRKRISFLCDDNIALNSNRYYRQFLKRPRFSFGKNGYDDIDKKSGNTDNAMHMVLNTKVIRYLFTRIIDLFPSYTLESLSLNQCNSSTELTLILIKSKPRVVIINNSNMLILNTLSSIIIKKRGAIQDNTRNIQDIIYKDIIILNIQDNYTNV